MTRHGIVIPLPDVVPPDCGGPTFCAVCNAEMIEVESLAIGISAGYERRAAKVRNEPRPDHAALNALWIGSLYRRCKFRADAIRFILLRKSDEGEWRRRSHGGGRPKSANTLEAEWRGMTTRQYRYWRHTQEARKLGLSTREWILRRRAGRLTSDKITGE